MADRLKPSNMEIFKKGKEVFRTFSMPYEDFENWVVRVAENTNLPVDWRLFGGGQYVFSTGELSKVVKVMLRPEFEERYDQMFEEATGGIMSIRAPYLRDHLRQTALDKIYTDSSYAPVLQMVGPTK